jgi:hypothetical protein
VILPFALDQHSCEVSESLLIISGQLIEEKNRVIKARGELSFGPVTEQSLLDFVADHQHVFILLREFLYDPYVLIDIRSNISHLSTL